MQQNGATVRTKISNLDPQGVWRESTRYLKGDAVTCDRSLFVAQVDRPKCRPGTTPDWRLYVGRGRDGKDRILEPGESLEVGA